jgi:transposase
VRVFVLTRKKSALLAFVVPVGENRPTPHGSGWKDGCPTQYTCADHAFNSRDMCCALSPALICHKSNHTVVFIDGIGIVRGTLTFPTTTEGYEAALSEAARLGCSEWGIEGSGLYGYAFAIHAAATGASVFEVPGICTKRNRRASSRRGKSDTNDAKAIAETVLREQDRLTTFRLATTQRTLRLRYEQRDRFVRDRTIAVNRIRSAALLLGISELPADLTPTKAARRLAEIAAGFASSTNVRSAMSATLDDIIDAAERIILLNARIKRVESIIRPMVREIAPELLEIHGVSEVAAAGLIGHTGDLRGTRDASAFAMKCGAAPVECSSGRRETVRVNLGGDRQLNRILHTAALSQVRRSGHPGRLYYDRKRAEGKTHLASMRCLKRTLATIVFYRLREADKRLHADILGDAAA